MNRRQNIGTSGSLCTAVVSQWGNLRVVNSVQRGTFTLASTTTGTATIASVNINQAELVFLGITQSQANSNFAVAVGRVALTNATTITGTMGANAGNAVFSYEVMEYAVGILKSYQQGTVNVSGNASATATVTSVNTLKSRLTNVGYSIVTTGASTTDAFSTKSVLTNATTITSNRNTADATNTVVASYQLLEYN